MSWPFQPLLAASAQQQANLALEMPAGAGLFAIDGGSAVLRVARRVSAASGEFALTGGATLLVRAYRLSADAGSIQITGADIGSSQGVPRWRDLALCIGL